MKLHYPNMIYSILITQGLIPLGHGIIRSSSVYKVNEKLLGETHVKDVKSVNPSSDSSMPYVNEENYSLC